MKSSSYLHSLVSAAAFCLLSGACSVNAQNNDGVRFTQGSIVTYSTIAITNGGGFTVTNDADCVVTVLNPTSGFAPSLQWTLNIGGQTLVSTGQPYPTSFPPIIAGLATISITNNSGSGALLTAKIEKPLTNTVHTAQGSIVIPADAGGPVSVILESSVDMITWTAANPGTYGTSTTNRFFRVRAVRQ